MILKTLWIQRTCGYEGEYAPECLLAVDEYSYSDNSIWFDKECINELKKVKDCISSHAIIDIEIDVAKIDNVLNNIPKIIKGDIK